MGDTRNRECQPGDRIAYKNFLGQIRIVDVFYVDPSDFFHGTDIENGDKLWGYFYQIVANPTNPDGIV